MNEQPLKMLYRKLQHKGYSPKHVAEVGVYVPETSNIYDYIVAGIRTTLVEPDPLSIRRIQTSFGEFSNVTLHQVAAYDYVGELNLSQRDASTFVSELSASPAIVNDGYVVNDEDKFSVQCTTFNTLDDGTIDLISIDTEGSEWYVLKHMVSRPDVISIETHGAAYLNPKYAEITDWMASNHYRLLYKDKTDSVYVKAETIKVSLYERLILTLVSLKVGVRRLRKRLLH